MHRYIQYIDILKCLQYISFANNSTEDHTDATIITKFNSSLIKIFGEMIGLLQE